MVSRRHIQLNERGNVDTKQALELPAEKKVIFPVMKLNEKLRYNKTNRNLTGKQAS